jgi:hypothetical protein
MDHAGRPARALPELVHAVAFDRRGRLVVAGESNVTAFTAWYDEHG